MGTWGAGLYDDDEASDLKNTIGLLCKVPASGDRLLELLQRVLGERDYEGEAGLPFWLVVADQFEKRGIECASVSTVAMSLIDSGADIAHARQHGADEKFLKKRALVLGELRQRLIAPRPFKSRKTSTAPPDAVLRSGEIYAFPAMDGIAWSPYRLSSDAPFLPNEWGALVVLETGRAFDWFPWCALASLTVDPKVKPTLADAMGARLITHLQTDGAGRFIPNKAHVAGLGLELIGKVELDPALVQSVLSPQSVEFALQLDWPVSHATYSASYSKLPIGAELSSLVL